MASEYDYEYYGDGGFDGDDDISASDDDVILGDIVTSDDPSPPPPRRRRRRRKRLKSSSSRFIRTEPSWRHIDDRGSDGKIPRDDCYEYKPAGSSRGERSWTECY